MSVLLETDLTEYARQCTLQRRRYEECVQEAQKSGMNQSTAATACLINQSPAETLTENRKFDECTELATQGSVVDLLGMSVEPLPWNDKQYALDDASNEVTEHQWHGDRSQSAQQHVASSARNAKPVSYGAP